MPCALEQAGLGMTDGEARSNSSTATAVISLIKVKNFLPNKYKTLASNDEQGPPLQPQQTHHHHQHLHQQQHIHHQQQMQQSQSQSRAIGQRVTDSQPPQPPPNCPLTHPVPSTASSVVDENRSGSSGLDASPMPHAFYGGPGPGGRVNTSPPTSHSQAMVVVPQPVKGAGHSNGTGRKYQCKMCPQVS